MNWEEVRECEGVKKGERMGERETRENRARRHAHATVPVVDSTSQQGARASNLLPPPGTKLEIR